MKSPKSDEGLRDALRASLTRRGLELKIQEKGTVRATAGKLGFIELDLADGHLEWRVWVYGSGQWYYGIDKLNPALDFLVEELEHIEDQARRALGKGKP